MEQLLYITVGTLIHYSSLAGQQDFTFIGDSFNILITFNTDWFNRATNILPLVDFIWLDMCSYELKNDIILIACFDCKCTYKYIFSLVISSVFFFSSAFKNVGSQVKQLSDNFLAKISKVCLIISSETERFLSIYSSLGKLNSNYCHFTKNNILRSSCSLSATTVYLETLLIFYSSFCCIALNNMS